MSSYRQINYQIVFATKNRESTINTAHEEELYRYVSGIIRNLNCKSYKINGMPDHIHICSDLHPSICLADFIKNIKIGSSNWMKESGKFPIFNGWQGGYGAFTYSEKEKERVVQYIENQKEHHKKESFIDEYRRLLIENGVAFDEKYLL